SPAEHCYITPIRCFVKQSMTLAMTGYSEQLVAGIMGCIAYFLEFTPTKRANGRVLFDKARPGISAFMSGTITQLTARGAPAQQSAIGFVAKHKRIHDDDLAAGATPAKPIQ